MRGVLDIYAKSGVLYRKLWQWNGRKALMKKGMTSLTALLLTLLLALGGVAFSDGNVESPSLSDEEVITCEHEFMETFEYENGRSEFIPLNDWEHVFNAYAPAW